MSGRERLEKFFWEHRQICFSGRKKGALASLFQLDFLFELFSNIINKKEDLLVHLSAFH
jgi:hypothetical protein